MKKITTNETQNIAPPLETEGGFGLLFDYGGTLDTNGTHWFEVICKMYFEVGIEPDKEMLKKAYVFAERMLERYSERILPTNSFKDVLQQKINYQIAYLVRKKMIEDVTPHKIDMLVDACYRYARRTVQEQKLILEVLYKKYPLILVSNFYGNLRRVLQDFGIDIYFKDVIESAVVGVRKPDPEIFNLGIQALRMDAKQVAVVGDSYKNDIAPAKKLGCTTIWLKGIGWDDHEDNTLTADYVISDLIEILQIIK